MSYVFFKGFADGGRKLLSVVEKEEAQLFFSRETALIVIDEIDNRPMGVDAEIGQIKGMWVIKYRV